MKSLPLISLAILVASCRSGSTDPLDPEVLGRKMITLQEKFNLIDLDGDGELTREEIIAGYDELDVVNQSPETADAIIRFYDFDKNGTVSLRETQSGAVTGPEEAARRFESGELSR